MFFVLVALLVGGVSFKRLKAPQLKEEQDTHTQKKTYGKLFQFFKQGPAYKKEGPDPNKGSNQQ